MEILKGTYREPQNTGRERKPSRVRELIKSSRERNW